MKCLEYKHYSEWLLLFFGCAPPNGRHIGMKDQGFCWKRGRDRNTDAVFPRHRPWSWPTTVCDPSWRGSERVWIFSTITSSQNMPFLIMVSWPDFCRNWHPSIYVYPHLICYGGICVRNNDEQVQLITDRLLFLFSFIFMLLFLRCHLYYCCLNWSS